MEFDEKEPQKLDLYVLLEDFLRQARRLWLLGLVLVLLCGAGLGFLKGRSFTPFMVASLRPLFEGIIFLICLSMR